MATKGASNHYGNARGGRQGHMTDHTGFAWAKDFNKHSFKNYVNEHMKSLKLSSPESYRAHAIEFANRVDRENNVSYIRKNGQTVKFSKKTGEFAVIDKKGYVTTYYKPDNGIKYYLKDRSENKK